MKNLLFIAALALFLLSGCISANKSMREANTLVNIQKSDFQISDQVTGTAKQIKVIGIDWKRLFKKEKSSLYIQIIGHNVRLNKVERYALYDLMLKYGTGYDVVFYPAFDYRKVNVLGIYQKTEVTAAAKLGKLKKSE